IVRGLGKTWELAQNTYKPYPCGIVGHPIIDACLEIRKEGQAIETIELHVHPLVRLMMGNPAPRTGLEAKLSIAHCAAAALLRGEVGVREFSDACVNDPALAALRARVKLVEDPAMPKEAARAVVSPSGGAQIEKYVPHAAGSLERPLSDEALERKFRSLAEWGWPGCDARAFIELAWSLDQLPDAAAFVRAAAPR